MPSLGITGLGAVTAKAVGLEAFRDSLRTGTGRFGLLQRESRPEAGPFIGAEIDDKALPVCGNRRLWRTLSLSSKAALVAASEALDDAGLGPESERLKDRKRIGLVVGGDGFHSGHRDRVARRYQNKIFHVLPSYGLSLWDSDLAGALSETLALQGECFSVGGASAGGAVAVIHGAREVLAGRLDAVLVVGPVCDLSGLELRALANLGALGGAAFLEDPDRAARSFDQDRDGFIYGEGCAALVLERLDGEDAPERFHGCLIGWGTARDGRRGPEPDSDGQQRAMRDALSMAGLAASDIQYVNPHGSGSGAGDVTELASLRAVGLDHCRLNSTKSITGHCLTAAGMLESVATVIQLEDRFLHPCRNLENPIEPDWAWVRDTEETGTTQENTVSYGLSNSFAFGGLSTTLVFARDRPDQIL